MGSHLTRLGTKEDVQDKIDFFADILAGSELGHATVSLIDVGVGLGVTDPTHVLTGHSWCVRVPACLRSSINADDRILCKHSCCLLDACERTASLVNACSFCRCIHRSPLTPLCPPVRLLQPSQGLPQRVSGAYHRRVLRLRLGLVSSRAELARRPQWSRSYPPLPREYAVSLLWNQRYKPGAIDVNLSATWVGDLIVHAVIKYIMLRAGVLCVVVGETRNTAV